MTGLTRQEWDDHNTRLMVISKLLNDAESTRLATNARLIGMKKEPGISPDLFELQEHALGEQVKVEKFYVRELENAMKEHPFGPWVASRHGVGYKTVARLLAILGNPGDRDSPSQLYAYSGLHVIDGQTPRRVKGQQANWNSVAKSLCWQIAEQTERANKPGHHDKIGRWRPSAYYADVYHEAKSKYAGDVHEHPCPACGLCDSCGKPPNKDAREHAEKTGCDDRRLVKAGAGTPLRPGHIRARAYRIVMKRFLLELWIEGRRLMAEIETNEQPVAA